LAGANTAAWPVAAANNKEVTTVLKELAIADVNFPKETKILILVEFGHSHGDPRLLYTLA
jgi:hypothetical protein